MKKWVYQTKKQQKRQRIRRINDRKDHSVAEIRQKFAHTASFGKIFKEWKHEGV